MKVFATVVMVPIFSRLGSIRAASATTAALFSTAIFLLGGIPGTFHHVPLYEESALPFWSP